MKLDSYFTLFAKQTKKNHIDTKNKLAVTKGEGGGEDSKVGKGTSYMVID